MNFQKTSEVDLTLQVRNKNKIKNFTNYNIQYESSQLRCTEELDTIISELLCESLKKLKIENKKYCKINVK